MINAVDYLPIINTPDIITAFERMGFLNSVQVTNKTLAHFCSFYKKPISQSDGIVLKHYASLVKL